jgi:hypothetical protein
VKPASLPGWPYAIVLVRYRGESAFGETAPINSAGLLRARGR